MPRIYTGREDAGCRLDAVLARRLPRLSRARWQQLIREGLVTVAGAPRKAGHLLAVNDAVDYSIPPAVPAALPPEPIPIEILFEDRHLIVLNKPPGLVVHPAPGHDSGTLVNALLHHCGDLAVIGEERRPGIVHRLDRDTSGVLVAAKTEKALRGLIEQFKNRSVGKVYLALVWGRPEPAQGTINLPVGRSTRDRKKMAAHPGASRRPRQAVTSYCTLETFRDTSLLRVTIATGRTHQIRVHMAHGGHAVVGDRVYGRRSSKVLPAPARRQMLHAFGLSFTHPVSGATLSCRAPLPPDMENLLQALRADVQQR